MKKSLRNLVIAAVMAVTAVTASTAAFAGTMQYVQTDMNFRAGAGTNTAAIGGVPAGAQVEFLESQNGWDMIRYNGTVGFIHGGNLGSSYSAPQTTSSTKAYYDNNWTQTAQKINNAGTWRNVYVANGYLALRTAPTFENSNEIGQLHNGDSVQITGAGTSGSYVQVYCPKFGTTGWVNAGFLV